jgi:hypothetical protein
MATTLENWLLLAVDAIEPDKLKHCTGNIVPNKLLEGR